MLILRSLVLRPYLLRVKGGEAQELELGPVKLKVSPRTVIAGIVAGQKKHVPPKYFAEMDGLADGAKIKRPDVYAANFIPEEKMEVIRPGEKHEQLPHPVPNTILMSAGDRYEELARRAKAKHGKFDAEQAMRLMDRPVAMNSNLHNALFAPASTRFWVANASRDGTPAADQPYHAFQLTDLLAREPAPGAPVISSAAREMSPPN